MKISEIDKNFKVEHSPLREGLSYVDARSLWVSGVFYEDGKFRRIPRALAELVKECSIY